MDLIALRKTLAEDEGVCKSRPSGSDVDRAATSEVKGGEVV